MINECLKAGVPKPSYYYDMSGFWVEFWKDIFDRRYLKKVGLNERQIKAVLYIEKHRNITNKDYQKINSISNEQTLTN